MLKDNLGNVFDPMSKQRSMKIGSCIHHSSEAAKILFLFSKVDRTGDGWSEIIVVVIVTTYSVLYPWMMN
jgi:hypothetical protein